MSNSLNSKLETAIGGAAGAEESLQALVEVVGKLLDCDRCCLFLRQPATRMSRMTHEWERKPEFALTRDSTDWSAEPASLENDDPMFAEALVNPDALFIDDVRTAEPGLVNAEYEEKHFGHRALVHAPVFHEGGMYGILEPCVFGKPRAWSETDRALVARVQNKAAAMIAAYVNERCPPT